METPFPDDFTIKVMFGIGLKSQFYFIYYLAYFCYYL